MVRGPYALTWGAGALSAIQAETFKPAFRAGEIHHDRHPVWPAATLTNAGGYAQVLVDRGRSTLVATVRTRWAELLVTNTAAQARVASARLEAPTEGWTTIDLMGGVRLREG